MITTGQLKSRLSYLTNLQKTFEIDINDKWNAKRFFQYQEVKREIRSIKRELK